jgi:hypothetical protein
MWRRRHWLYLQAGNFGSGGLHIILQERLATQCIFASKGPSQPNGYWLSITTP